ncbi:MAG: 1-acyl-sn-glycerol-3-phosphate acyltransferase [Ottowia sp.]|nr:1-acyl-sn-glycerol-3-phosphate acyltransferase [Ottowia sp.]
MQSIRSILFLFFLILYTPLYACACLIAFPFLTTHHRYTMVRGWCRPVIYVAEKLCGIRYQIIGFEHCIAAQSLPVVVLSKHQSAWETIAYVALLPKRLCYVFKRELLYVPFFGWVLGLLRMVHIDRQAGHIAFASVARQGRRCLKEGAWIMMFPEGTRIPSGTQGRYKVGGARLAIETNAWVLPIAHNAGRCWPRHTILKYPGEVTISIGPAISSQGKTITQLNHEVESWIEREMRVIDADCYR